MDFDKKNLPEMIQNSFPDLLKVVDSFLGESIDHLEPLFSQPFSVLCYETGAHIVVEAELPDCKKDQIEIKMLRNGQLKISVEHAVSTTAENNEEVLVFKNQSFQKYERTVALPCTPGAGKAKAAFTDGLLRIIIPKGKQEETKIEIE
ncbi:Hsp20/alpha crystallin family protein [Domibacillus indicus]|uniref:Hsp20/alpha crystallin family protein n=1 Tax=Domibacillus indicus TaxID=1437523 RepID=UPI0006182EF9|nr:Hsp20/alpha crystallin family protein [Domibacillus indicus]